MTLDLFADLPAARGPEPLAPGAVVLRGFALDQVDALLSTLELVLEQAPLRQMTTAGGHCMSVTTSSCGRLGWVSDARGYRYSGRDPATGRPWPAIPKPFHALARSAAKAAGYAGFTPDTCLINQYTLGAGMGLHQDRNERDPAQPIVSVSLGVPARFQFGGLRRQNPVQRIVLQHGDVAVWGGPARMRFHGVMPLQAHSHPLLGARRINLTFRSAG